MSVQSVDPSPLLVDSLHSEEVDYEDNPTFTSTRTSPSATRSRRVSSAVEERRMAQAPWNRRTSVWIVALVVIAVVAIVLGVERPWKSSHQSDSNETHPRAPTFAPSMSPTVAPMPTGAPTQAPSTAPSSAPGAVCASLLQCATCIGTNMCGSCASGFELRQHACAPIVAPRSLPVTVSFKGQFSAPSFSAYNNTLIVNTFANQYETTIAGVFNEYYDGYSRLGRRCNFGTDCYPTTVLWRQLLSHVPPYAKFVREVPRAGSQPPAELWRWNQSVCTISTSVGSQCQFDFLLTRIPRNRSLPLLIKGERLPPHLMCQRLLQDNQCTVSDGALPISLSITGSSLAGPPFPHHIVFSNLSCLSDQSRDAHVLPTDPPTAAPTAYPTPAPTPMLPTPRFAAFYANISVLTASSWRSSSTLFAFPKAFVNSSSRVLLSRVGDGAAAYTVLFQGSPDMSSVTRLALWRNGTCHSPGPLYGLSTPGYSSVIPMFLPGPTSYQGLANVEGEMLHHWRARSPRAIEGAFQTPTIDMYLRYVHNHNGGCNVHYTTPNSTELFGNISALPVMFVARRSFGSSITIRYDDVTCAHSPPRNSPDFDIDARCPSIDPPTPVPTPDSGICARGPIVNMSMFRYHDPPVNFTCGLVDRNTADAKGDSTFICNGVSVFFQGDVNTKVMTEYVVEVNTTWASYSLCNDMSCDNRQFGEPVPPHNVGRVPGYYNYAGSQCSPNVYPGSWYSMTHQSYCYDKPVKYPCGWGNVRRGRTVSMACVNKGSRLVIACEAMKHDFRLPGEIIRMALASDDPAKGGCPDVTLPPCVPYVPPAST